MMDDARRPLTLLDAAAGVSWEGEVGPLSGEQLRQAEHVRIEVEPLGRPAWGDSRCGVSHLVRDRPAHLRHRQTERFGQILLVFAGLALFVEDLRRDPANRG